MCGTDFTGEFRDCSESVLHLFPGLYVVEGKQTESTALIILMNFIYQERAPSLKTNLI